MSWCFAIVNSGRNARYTASRYKRLAEIFFEKEKKTKIFGHCYVLEEEYKTKREKKQIKEDTAQVRFVYRKGKYKRLNNA